MENPEQPATDKAQMRFPGTRSKSTSQTEPEGSLGLLASKHLGLSSMEGTDLPHIQISAGRLYHYHFTDEKNEPVGDAVGKLRSQSELTQARLRPHCVNLPTSLLITTSHRYRRP